MDLLRELSERYANTNLERLLTNFRIDLFLKKTQEWADTVKERKSMAKEDAQLFIDLNLGASELVNMLRDEVEKREAYTVAAYEYALKWRSAEQELMELKATMEKMNNHISKTF